MNNAALITALVALPAGIAIEYFRQWGRSFFASRAVRAEIRKALAAEIHGNLVSLNFYIQAALEDGDTPALEAQYFNKSWSLNSFTYYWESKRDDLLKLPEWATLKNWASLLAQIRNSQHPPLFNAIMLFLSLETPPLNKLLNRDSRTFVHRVLENRKVKTYRVDYLQSVHRS